MITDWIERAIGRFGFGAGFEKIDPRTFPEGVNPFDEFPDVESDTDVPADRGAYFPLRYVTDFFDFLKEHRSKIEVLTYADFPWEGNRHDVLDNYMCERKAWARQLETGERDKTKAYVLIQYDVDSNPHRAMELLAHPSHDGIRANVMLFNRRIDRRRYKATGEVAYTRYELDEDLLRGREAEGHVIGYHANAYEQADYDQDKALDIFEQDVNALSERFTIRFFSAHGGVPGPDGRNNHDLAFPEHLRERLVWVHNRRTMRFDGQFSDGGHNSPKRDPLQRDLRDFVRTFKPGKRYRILLHPQYYDAEPRLSRRYRGTPWYDKLMKKAAKPGHASLWRGVRLGWR